jgi:hypothetical protein
MGKWRDTGTWLLTAGGGFLAAVAAAYLLYLLPPERVLGRDGAAVSAVPTPTGGLVGKPESEPLQKQSTAPVHPVPPSSLPPELSSPELRQAVVPAGTGVGTEVEVVPHPTLGEMPESRSTRLDSSAVRFLTPEAPVTFSEIDAVVSVSFRDTLGSQYAEFLVDAPGQSSFRFPARSAGAAKEFTVGGRAYEIRVVAIDWRTLSSRVTLRQLNS